MGLSCSAPSREKGSSSRCTVHTLKSYRATGYSACPMDLVKCVVVPEDDSGTLVPEDSNVP